MSIFSDVEPIRYGGPGSGNLSFHAYDPQRLVLRRRMEDLLRYPESNWH
jgi:xylose isomerase